MYHVKTTNHFTSEHYFTTLCIVNVRLTECPSISSTIANAEKPKLERWR